MKKLARRALFLAAIGALFTLPRVAVAQGFDFELLDLTVSGESSFSDDFEDGLRDEPPTSILADGVGTTTESGGSLVFSSADGAGSLEPGVLMDRVELIALLIGPTTTQPLVADARFSPLPEVPEEAFGIVYANIVPGDVGSELATVGVGFFASPSAPCPGLAAFYALPDGSVSGCDPIDPSGVSGPIVVRLIADPSQLLVFAAYSLDSGASFVPGFDWSNPPPLIPLPAGQFSSIALFAQGPAAPPVPLTGAIGSVVLACALAGSVAWRRLPRRR